EPFLLEQAEGAQVDPGRSAPSAEGEHQLLLADLLLEGGAVEGKFAEASELDRRPGRQDGGEHGGRVEIHPTGAEDRSQGADDLVAKARQQRLQVDAAEAADAGEAERPPEGRLP